jgi:rRNA maturation endonuclease Nob1
MGLVSTLRDVVEQWRETDPYHYECTVCERSFQSDHTVCPDCGGDVERVAGAFDSAAVDPHP